MNFDQHTPLEAREMGARVKPGDLLNLRRSPILMGDARFERHFFSEVSPDEGIAEGGFYSFVSDQELFIVVSVCSVSVKVKVDTVQGIDHLFTHPLTYALVPLDRPDHQGKHRAFGWLNVDDSCEVVSRP